MRIHYTKKWSFPLRISSVNVNVTKSAWNCGFGYTYYLNLSWKTFILLCIDWYLINPFHATDLFWYPWKHQKIRGFFDVFRGYKNETLTWNWLLLSHFACLSCVRCYLFLVDKRWILACTENKNISKYKHYYQRNNHF